MTETQVGFLFKVASSLQNAGSNKSLAYLRSYYLMRCKDITKGYGLPEKHFSSKIRCQKCCIEWDDRTQIQVKPIKLSRKQRRRIKSRKANNTNKQLVEKKKLLLNSNEIEQLCSFCKQKTITTAVKPEKIKVHLDFEKAVEKQNSLKESHSILSQENKASALKETAVTKKKSKQEDNAKLIKKKEVNVYSVTKDIFSLNNKNNTLLNTSKVEQKVIKNNKKKKDKFAGLCEKAVLASAKLKEEKNKHVNNKLNLFLKPSS